MITLLIDGDILAYQAACVAQNTTDWGDGLITTDADSGLGVKLIVEAIGRYMEVLSADDFRVALSDSSRNFRKRVLPSYKHHRSAEKPIILQEMKDYLTENYGAKTVPWLEGDDVLGIWATSPHKGERIIVSADKDMRTIPGPLYSPHKGRRDLGVIDVSAADADRYHLLQSLTGDSTDGYSGCPGVGPEAANILLDDPRHLTRIERVRTRGKDAGKIAVEWVPGEPCSPWEAIIDRYAKADLTPQHALAQARVARILRASDYNSKTQKVILWSPTSTP